MILETEFAGFNGVGQGTIVDDKDGNWYGIVFQDRGGVGRVLTLEPCTWKDGWPMLTDEKGNIPAKMQKPVLGYDGKGLVYSDDFSKDKRNCSGSGTTILWIMPGRSQSARAGSA